jgi:hypothetical protein
MIGVIFMYGPDMLEVRVDGNNITFRSGSQPAWATIEGLQLSHEGVIKEFPDLDGDSSWRTQAIERFKDKISSLKKETDKVAYIVEDLKKHGYCLKYMQKGGQRVKRVG